ncbi:repressor of RNA polymerase iii transcription maf1 [Anaeramoeba flamelloides]|uniref:Repressor of RNA polymerase III transcription n=1 Tax=Anaeramoeba flamelloides TaxID=1746091 RepID=A0AAV7YI37_9EUKA|nr:repressor of RNA polymerase iii transcription maf1 [Anaeramoeba flamelloides]KAJ6227137.1 repressor of RNA polymerase iii transcription maf1 [Anaeramoeba flamelloides]
MKFLNCPGLERVTELLSGLITGTGVVNGKVEAYSEKPIKSDRKLAKSLEQQYTQEITKGLITRQGSGSFGSLYEPNNRKTLIKLISTMNHSFPEYDFSSVREHHFNRENSLSKVQNAINITLNSCVDDYYPEKAEVIWTEIDDVISLEDCQVYSYIPGLSEEDPFSQLGVVWSMNYFFVNTKLKRVIYFTTQCISFNSEMINEQEFEEQNEWFQSENTWNKNEKWNNNSSYNNNNNNNIEEEETMFDFQF